MSTSGNALGDDAAGPDADTTAHDDQPNDRRSPIYVRNRSKAVLAIDVIDTPEATPSPSIAEVSIDAKALAEELKLHANGLYAKADYSGAVAGYSGALVHDPKNAVLYANRSQAYLKLERCAGSFVMLDILTRIVRWMDAAVDASEVRCFRFVHFIP